MYDFEGRIPGIEAIRPSTEPYTVPVYFDGGDGKRVEIGHAEVVGEIATCHFKDDLRGLDERILHHIRADTVGMSFRKTPPEAEHLLIKAKKATALPELPTQHISIDHLYDKFIEENP